MGSLPRPRPISDLEIISRYQAGESRGLLGLRCKVGDSVIVQVLRDAGVPLRTAAEGKRLSTQLSAKQSLVRGMQTMAQRPRRRRWAA